MNYQNNKTETSVIQLALKRAGFLDGEIDGIFGSDTRNAVIAFQKAASLSPDGIVGPKTYAALLPYLKGNTIHRVKKGDSLYSIAAMHNTSIRNIMLANPTVDPLNLQESVETVRECAALPGVKAIIFKSPCVAITKPQGRMKIGESCIGCKKCIREIGCPAIVVKDGQVTIEEGLCTGCGLCSQVCPTAAIIGGKKHE